MSTIDIKDFSVMSQASPQDWLLIAQSGGGAHGKMQVQLLVDAVKRLVSDGKTVNLRNQGGRIEWQHEGDNSWQELVPIETIKGDKGDEGADGKTPKLVSVNATAGESASGSITKSGDDSQGNPEYSLDLTLPRGQRGDDGSDGKTPRFEVGTISTLDPSQSATATVRYIGQHTDGSPKYAIDMGIPRGVAGSLGQGNAENLTVTFTEAKSKENINSGEKFSVLMGKIKKWFSSLHALAFSGKFSDISGKPTTLQGYGITDASPSDHNHDSVYAVEGHTHDYASTSHSHDDVYLKKSFYEGSNTVSSLSNLPIDKRVIKAVLSSPSNLSLSGTLDEWKSIHVVAKATSEFSLPIPNSGGWKTNKELLSVKNGQIVELNIMYIHGTYIVLSNIL